MKKILFILTIIAAVPSLAGEWALVDSSGTVVRVIVANGAAMLDRDDGPWIKTGPKKVGIGWTYDGSKFNAPGSAFAVAASSGSANYSAPGSTFTVVSSSSSHVPSQRKSR
jgi:hypothetical protein